MAPHQVATDDASYNELLPLYALYKELTSESYYGPHGEPHVSLVMDAVRAALWTKKLHFEFEAPFDPLLPEPEWEPPPLDKLRKYIPPQTPSEIWGRRDKETFIGIRLKDQKGKPIIGSRIRVKLPDGNTKEGKTNTDGELEIKGFTQDGNTDITFLDHCKPGKTGAPEWPEEKEFKATCEPAHSDVQRFLELQPLRRFLNSVERHGKLPQHRSTDADAPSSMWIR